MHVFTVKHRVGTKAPYSNGSFRIFGAAKYETVEVEAHTYKIEEGLTTFILEDGTPVRTFRAKAIENIDVDL